MKITIKKLRYCPILVAMFVVSANMAIAQSKIYDSDQLSEWSIIRNYKNGIDICYNAFLNIESIDYIDRINNTVISASLRNKFLINDFVIFEDKVYFAGQLDYGHAVYGFFDIYDVFFMGGSIRLIIPQYQDPSLPGYAEITSLGSLAVKRAPSGDIHMLMTGRGYCVNGDVSSKDRPVYYAGLIVDAWVDSYTGFDMIRYTVDREYQYIYDYVTMTDNYGVITAHTVDGGVFGTHNFFYYPDPTIVNDSYFSSLLILGTTIAQAPMQTTSVGVMHLPTNDMVYITKMEHDGFATVCYCCDTNNNRMVVASIYDSPLIPPIERFVIPASICCQEITYNPLQKILYILPDLRNSLLSIPQPFNLSIRNVTEDYRWVSISNADMNTKEIISGYEHSTFTKKYWLYDIALQNHCERRSVTENTRININEIFGYRFQEINRDNPISEILIPEIQNYSLKTICR